MILGEISPQHFEIKFKFTNLFDLTFIYDVSSAVPKVLVTLHPVALVVLQGVLWLQ